MSIPSLKRLGFSNFIRDNHGSDSLHRIPPQPGGGPAQPAPTSPPGATGRGQRGPSAGTPRGPTAGRRALGAVGVLVLLITVPLVQADVGYFESFSDANDVNGQDPVPEPVTWYSYGGDRFKVLNGVLDSVCSITGLPYGGFDCANGAGNNGVFTLANPVSAHDWQVDFDLHMHRSLLTHYPIITFAVGGVIEQIQFIPHGGQNDQIQFGRTPCVSSAALNIGPVLDYSGHIAVKFTQATNTLELFDGAGTCSLTPATAYNGASTITFGVSANAGTLATRDFVTVDNLIFNAGEGFFTPPLAPNAVVAVTDLVGFDVDDTGTVVIARHDNGKIVQIYGGQSLAGGATATDNDCDGKADGVSTYATSTDVYTTYFECSNSGSNPANSLKIRSGSLGDPTVPAACAFVGNGDTTTLLDVNVPDTLREISSLGNFPIDFSRCRNNSGASNTVIVSWGFSTTNGQVGVFAVVKENNLPDHSDSAFITFDGGGSPSVNQICVFADGTTSPTTDHLGAVGLNAGTKFYLPQVVNPATVPDATITQDYSISGTYNLARALSCAGYRAIIINEAGSSISEICTVNGHCPTGISQGQPIWTNILTPSGQTNARGAVISGNTAFAAYHKLGSIIVINATNGTTLATLPEPQSTGALLDMRMDRSGSNLWLAYNDHIYRFDIHNFTCLNNCVNTITDNSGGGGGGGGNGTGGPNLEDNVYFWIVLWIVVAVIGTALLSWGTRAGFSGLVYIVVITIVYIIGMLLNNTDGGTTNVSPWPIVAVASIAIGFGITRWIRS